MKTRIATYLLCLAVIFCLSSAAYAQGVTTAAINGIVADRSGQPLPLANVVAVHVPTGTVYGISARDDGRYFLSGLKVGGPYTVTAKLVGYRPQAREGVNLELSQNLRMDFALVGEAVELGEVAVIGERTALISAARTGAGTSVSKEIIERMPSVRRSFQDFQSIAPQFIGNSAAGRNNRYNNIQIDGANINDLFGLGSSGTPGGQANAQPISLDALQEFQVVIAPYDVRQSGFTGGGVNAITRSGTNTFSGSVYGYGRNQNQTGYSPANGKSKVADFQEYQAGFRVGGPVLKDQLFFFVNGELTRRKQPTDVGFTGGPLVGNVSSIPIDSVRKFESILRTKYGYDPGTFDPFDVKRQSNKLFLRLDYNISDQHRLTLRHNLVDAYDDNLARTVSSYYASNSLYKFPSVANQTVLQLTSSLGSSFANELILGYTAIRDKREVPGASFPFVQIRNFAGGATMSAGTENFSMANALDQDIFEVTDNFTYFAGPHVLTFGTHNEFYKASNLYIRNQYGYYEFANVAAFEAGTPSRYQYSYSTTGDPQQRAKFKAMQWGLYGQVESYVLSNLKITAGVRVDIPVLPDKPAYNRLVDSTFASMGIRTDKVPSGNLLWSPRLGVNWDVESNKMTQVRGGVGVFSGRVPFVWLSNQYSNTGVEFARLDVSSPAFAFVSNPNNQPRPGVTPGLSPIATSEIDVTATDYRMPQLMRLNAAVDHQFPLGIVGTLEFIYSQTVNDLVYQDINLKPSDTTAYDGRPMYGRYGTGTRTTPAKINARDFTNVLLVKNTSQGYQWSITAQLQRQLTDGLFGTVAYTYGRSKDRNSVLSSQAYSQWRYNPVPGNPNDPPLTFSSFDRPHRLVVALSYRHEFAPNWPTTISMLYSGVSGEPYSYVYNGDVNADGETSNDLVYVPKNASDIILKSNNYAQLDAYIEGEDYLRNSRGHIVERSGGRSPWIAHVDLHLAQEIPIFETHRFEVSIDVLNVMNLISNKMGRERYVPNQSYQLLKYEGLDAATKRPSFSFTPPTNGVPWQYSDIASRWQAQLGVRYSF